MFGADNSDPKGQRKRLIAAGAALLILAIFFYINEKYVFNFLYFVSAKDFFALTLTRSLPNVLGLLGASVLLLSYLRSEPERGLDPKSTQIAERKNAEDDGQREADVRVVIEHALEELQEEVSPAKGLSDREVIDLRFEDIQRRARREIENLSKRSNVNLVFGVAITVIGIGVLLYLVNHQPEYKDIPSVLSHYLPRITTVALIEAFAYFFLNLYKANLEEIKYYQNERTSATAWQIAWIAAQGEKKTKTASFVIRQLAQQDRNGKAQVKEVEKHASDTIDLASLLKVITKLSGDSKDKKEE